MKLSQLIKEAENALYSDAGDDAPEEVKAAIERWRQMTPEERGDKPLLYWLLGSGTPPYKMSMEDSKYVDQSEVEGQYCKNCEYIYLKLANKQFICSQISGRVRPAGWCRLWKTQDASS